MLAWFVLFFFFLVFLFLGGLFFLLGFGFGFFFLMTTRLRITVEHTTDPSIVVLIINGNSILYLYFAGGLVSLLVLKH